MKTDEIRNKFLKYFESKGHQIIESSALIPAGDPTLLFTNAGMVQFKDCFLGTDKRAYSRATTSQKCLRISGKHNDLENVGRTARHHTFFEMLGNFSFGDYFKRDAIIYAWEFLTDVVGLAKDRLWVTVYQEDDEAAELWKELTDVLPGRILRCGKEDNFWAMGDTGPCGPCTEIHYFLGDDVKNQSEEAFRRSDGTYLEIWNLVFMQFNRDPSGNLAPLPKPSVDTGMGLERIAAVKQGARANYDTDLLRQLIHFTENLSGKKYDGKDYTARDPEKDAQYGYDVAFRVIADHVRSSAFLIADGINPGSDGRGYVLRRLVRRACRHGRVLGFRQAFLCDVAREVVRLYGEVYPELRSSEDKIHKLLKAEEEKFLTTLDVGITVLRKEVERIKESALKTLTGAVAFQLHDTYGFPLDMTEDIVQQYGITVDHHGFTEQMELQRERSRAARGSDTALILQRSVKALPTKFVGYEFTDYESEIVGIFQAAGEIKSAKLGDEVAVVVRETPFYAESGGQVGDTGSISAGNGWLDVVDTQKAGGDTIVHICKVTEGAVGSGDAVRLAIDANRRKLIRVNHSATHLVHLALREVLGTHVKQAGSRVSENTLRFDFNHSEAITPEQLEEIESIVNSQILDNYSVTTELMPIDEAKRSGAMALFGEKYGSVVRVVQIGPRSRELCGGTHAERSGDIGFVSVLGEGSISAGVRRIEASAGWGALKRHREQRRLIKRTVSLLKSSEHELEDRVAKLLDRGRDIERQLERLNQSANVSHVSNLCDQAETLKDGSKLVIGRLENADPKQLRELADELKRKLERGIIVLSSVIDDKGVVLTAVTPNLTERFHAGKLMEEMAKVMGSRGGGRADMAQGGGDASKLDAALDRFRELVKHA